MTVFFFVTPKIQHPVRNFLYVSDLSKLEILHLFERAQKLKLEFEATGRFPRSLERQHIALLFEEASTRTRVSFQSAAQKMGAQTLLVEAGSSSSLSKGESFKDTFYTLLANTPDLMVVRCRAASDLEALAKESPVPIINGGFGAKAHPTQSLLDTLTLMSKGLVMDGLKCLFVGDLRHSRVFESHRQLAKILGYELAVCAPDLFLPNDLDCCTVFEKLDEGIQWANVYCGLRVQFERHDESSQFSKALYVKNFSLSPQRLQALSDQSWITHPGPIHWGTEFQVEVEKDPRLLFREQMAMGVYLRAALMEFLLHGELA